tara:strand:+ start:322 stop:591 length:270 start_codon:yes stop_codon:yes gene_type:complete
LKIKLASVLFWGAGFFLNKINGERIEMQNLKLKWAIVMSGKKNYEIANLLNWHQAKLSCIVNGIQPAKDSDKEALSKILRTPSKELFPN